jgi:hypothetical protein
MVGERPANKVLFKRKNKNKMFRHIPLLWVLNVNVWVNGLYNLFKRLHPLISKPGHLGSWFLNCSNLEPDHKSEKKHPSLFLAAVQFL